MTHIIVDEDQAKSIAESSGAVEIRDRKGAHLGYVTKGISAAEIELVLRRRESNETYRTTAEVFSHIESLDVS